MKIKRKILIFSTIAISTFFASTASYADVLRSDVAFNNGIGEQT